MALLLISSFIDSFGSQDKARIETFGSWIERLLSFDNKSLGILNHEELKSFQEEKQIFFNEIKFDENLLRHFHRFCGDFVDRVACQTTEEGLMSVIKEMEYRFCLENPTFMDVLLTALDKFILEKNKKQRYTAPAA